MFDKVKEHNLVSLQEVDWAIAEVGAAKNSLRRRHGYSPTQWLFGVGARVGDGLLDEEDVGVDRQAFIKPSDDWKRRQEIRNKAREAFVQTQASDSLQRAVLGRPRVVHGELEPGQYVYIYRTMKTAGGVARQRQNIGEWIGPGIIVGKEGKNYWVSRGGRCLLCAREHLRLAESEELGGVLQARAVKEDLAKLLVGMEMDDEEVFADATGDLRPLDDSEEKEEEDLAAGDRGELKRKGDELVPERRMKQKGTGPMIPRESRAKASEEALVANEVRVPRSLQKQADKELKWHQIPDEEKPLYKGAEIVQWDQHLKYQAINIIPPQDAEVVRKTVPKERILRARFAYRDKNCAKRRENPKVPPKPKARLCVGGHLDPDLKLGMLSTEAPTASKMAITTLVILTVQMGWKLAAGDIEAAFLNGDEARRDLYFEPPASGLTGVEPGSIIEIVKGVFGLSTSPRLWWDRLAGTLCDLVVYYGEETLKLEQHYLDNCLFLLKNERNELRGMLATHVDDILMSAEPSLLKVMEEALSGIFPIDSWDCASEGLEYCGISVKQADDQITLSQEHYVNSRLATVEIPKGVNSSDPADEVAKMDNQSTIGALSWLASQTRPDIQAGVSMAQRCQKHPTYADVKETNKVVRMAQQAKDESMCYSKLGEFQDLMLLVFHDAAWANVPPGVEDVDAEGDQGVYSQLGYVVLVANRNVLEGVTGQGALGTWKSHACPRVCRSTFAAETMAALEGWEAGIAFRAMLRGCFDGRHLPESQSWFPIVSMTDCKSLYDAVHRVGGPRAPSEKRVMVDLAALRQILRQEVESWPEGLRDLKAMRWLPTSHQVADNLTKVITKCKEWWQSLRSISVTGSKNSSGVWICGCTVILSPPY